uniref:Uncharacterized protein n=1 Tax=Panagrellus redivivus TaxID=6233 RepID=A0A7E4UQ91_PANRE
MINLGADGDSSLTSKPCPCPLPYPASEPCLYRTSQPWNLQCQTVTVRCRLNPSTKDASNVSVRRLVPRPRQPCHDFNLAALQRDPRFFKDRSMPSTTVHDLSPLY